MSLIYVPKGAAREYAELALNPYEGECPHRCGYCYNASLLRRQGLVGVPMRPKPDLLNRLRRECEKLAGDPRLIHLTFVADPYPVVRPDIHEVTREVLLILREHGLHWQMLTKGGAKAQADFDLYRAGDWFGVTLTCFDQATETEWEPSAECGPDRADNLLMAWEHGISTWVSMEPVIAPDALDWIVILKDFVDLWRVGKWNHQPADAPLIDWHALGQRLAGVLLGTGVRYYIKDSLRPFMPPGFAYENWPPEMRPEEART